MLQVEHTLRSVSYVKSGQGPKAIQPQAVYYRMLQAEYSLRSVSYLKQAWDIYSSVLSCESQIASSRVYFKICLTHQTRQGPHFIQPKAVDYRMLQAEYSLKSGAKSYSASSCVLQNAPSRVLLKICLILKISQGDIYSSALSSGLQNASSRAYFMIYVKYEIRSWPLILRISQGTYINQPRAVNYRMLLAEYTTLRFVSYIKQGRGHILFSPKQWIIECFKQSTL